MGVWLRMLDHLMSHFLCRSASVLYLLFPYLTSLLVHRRGNWITLKLKKLMKSNSREHGPERPPTPTHTGVAEPQLSCHDNSSFNSSDGSGGSASTSACDAVSPQRNSSEYFLLKFSRSSSEPERIMQECSSKVWFTATVQGGMGEVMDRTDSSGCEATFDRGSFSQNLTHKKKPFRLKIFKQGAKTKMNKCILK